LVRSNIELSVLLGWLLFISGKHDEALRHLRDMEHTFGLDQLSAEHPEQQALPPGSLSHAAILGRIAAIRASIALTRGDLPRTITLSRLTLEHLPKESMARSYVAGIWARPTTSVAISGQRAVLWKRLVASVGK
jgi:ATP/maltotriose-dependent transcriptional regulator MalT